MWNEEAQSTQPSESSSNSLELFGVESEFELKPIRPLIEVGAYEALWCRKGATFKRISEMFEHDSRLLPSDIVPDREIKATLDAFNALFSSHSMPRFGIRVHGEVEYPEKLRDAAHPVELLYYRGRWDLVFSRGIAVVGTRNPSPEGIRRTRKLVHKLVEDDFSIVSGLARGVDTVAHRAALETPGGRTYAVIGTPLNEVYPRENAELQKLLADNYLLVSPVPFLKYESQDYRSNRNFFPERNKLMSALTEATIIVEASDTSGTLIQAKAALKQNRKLFILDSCFKNSAITWPEKFEKLGAVRVSDYEDIRKHLNVPDSAKSNAQTHPRR